MRLQLQRFIKNRTFCVELHTKKPLLAVYCWLTIGLYRIKRQLTGVYHNNLLRRHYGPQLKKRSEEIWPCGTLAFAQRTGTSGTPGHNSDQRPYTGMWVWRHASYVCLCHQAA